MKGTKEGGEGAAEVHAEKAREGEQVRRFDEGLVLPPLLLLLIRPLVCQILSY